MFYIILRPIFAFSDENALVFATGNYIEYNFQKAVEVQEAFINVAFKTKLSDAVIFQLRGLTNAHITLLLIRGSLRLFFNFKAAETDVQSITFTHPSLMGVFNDDKRHIIRVHHKGNQMFAYVLDDNNKPINHTRNITAPFTTAFFPQPTRLSIGRRGTVLTGNPTTFSGCVSGLRYQYLPKNAVVGVNIDMVKLFTTANTNLIRSSPPPVNGSCGIPLPIPPPLPAIYRPLQFKFRNPVVTQAPIGSKYTFAKIVVVVIIIILAIIAVILLFVTVRCVEKYKKKYRRKYKAYKEEKLNLTRNEQQLSTTATAPARKEYYRDTEPEPEIPMQVKPQMHSQPQSYATQPQSYDTQPQSYDTKPQSYSSQPSYGADSLEYAPSAPKAKPGYAAAAPSSPDEKDDGDWFL